MKRGGAVEFAGFGKEFSHSFDGNLNKIVNASDLESDFSALTITVYSYEYPGSDDWWVNIDYGTSWSDDKLGKDNGTWNNDKKGWSWTITDAALIAKFKSNGIFIAGNPTATAKVTVSVPTNSEAQTPSDTDTSSSDGNSGTENGDEEESSTSIELYSESITLSASSLTSLIESSKLSSIDIKTLTITVYSFEYSGSGDWWVNIDYGTNWSDNKLGKDSGTWSDDKKGWSWTITDAALIAKFKSSGIYIAGNNDATATVTVSYQ